MLVFILSASFIAYAPELLKKSIDFSSDISNASLSLGTKIVMPHSDSQGKDSVDLIRDSLFPYGFSNRGYCFNTTVQTLKVSVTVWESLLSTSPDLTMARQRKIVAEEIEDRSNTNLTITKTINRLGQSSSYLSLNIGISIFVFLLTGIMIFSQVLLSSMLCFCL